VCLWHHRIQKPLRFVSPSCNFVLMLTRSGLFNVRRGPKAPSGGKLSQSYPCNRAWRPVGLWDVAAPTFSRQSAHRWRWGCQLYAPAALDPPGKFLVLISVRSWVDPRATVRLEGLGKMKNTMTHRESNQRPSGLWPSASTNCAAACPMWDTVKS
jgi:hypothetical protein